MNRHRRRSGLVAQSDHGLRNGPPNGREVAVFDAVVERLAVHLYHVGGGSEGGKEPGLRYDLLKNAKPVVTRIQ